MNTELPAQGAARRARSIARRFVGRVLSPILTYCRQPGWEALERAAEIDRSLLPLRAAAEQWRMAEADLRAGDVNLALLTAEVRTTEETLEHLARAIADCERRVRSLERTGKEGAGEEGADEAVAEEYGDRLVDHAPVLVLGSERGHLMRLLAAREVPATGLDGDDAGEYLASQPPRIFGAVVAIGVLEHLSLNALTDLLAASAARLRPGGLFLAATPNPTMLAAHDQRHRWHPQVLEFLLEETGFREIEVRFLGTATAGQIALLAASDEQPWVGQVNRAFTRLNEVFSGPRDFAVMATAGGDGDDLP
jgi:hypothetical protein